MGGQERSISSKGSLWPEDGILHLDQDYGQRNAGKDAELAHGYSSIVGVPRSGQISKPAPYEATNSSTPKENAD